jgi:hypothetical protein
VKFFIYLSLIVISASCAHKPKAEESLETIVKKEEVRNFKEIERHSKLVVERHPELSADTKSQLQSLISQALNRAQELRDEESQIIQLLLSKSIRAKDLTTQESATKLALIKRLDKVYDEKEKNVLTVISRIKDLSDNNQINEGLEKDMMIFLRDLR